jgi:hypothetical protein
MPERGYRKNQGNSDDAIHAPQNAIAAFAKTFHRVPRGR